MKKYLILTAFTAMMFVGCKNQNTTPAVEPENKGVAARFTAGGDLSYGVTTRVANDAWEENDQIGIYMVKPGQSTMQDKLDNVVGGVSNYPYVAEKDLTGGGQVKFAPANKKDVFFPQDGSDVDFLAYYPHQRVMFGRTISIDVSDQTAAKPEFNLMWAKKEGHSAATPDVKLEFTRSLTKVEVELAAGAGLKEDDIKEAKVSISGVPTKCTIGVLDGEITNHRDAAEVALNKKDELKFEGILIPHTNTDYGSRKISIELKDGSKFEVDVTEDAVAAKRRVYTITVSKETATKFSMEIVAWDDETPVDVTVK